MKILYIRRSDDVFLNSFVQEFSNENEISIFDARNRILKKVFTSNDLNIDIKKENKYINYIGRILFSIVFLLKIREKYDVIHLMNIKRENFWMVPFLRGKTKNLILSIYGRSTYIYRSKRFLFSKMYRYFDNIILTNEDLISDFIKIYPSLDKNKIILVGLPIKHYKFIKHIEDINEKNDICRKLGLKEGLINILCSSTTADYDQHDIVIDQVKKIENKSEVQIIFLLTYGGTIDRKKHIIERIDKELVPYFNVKVFDTFLSDYDIANLRNVIDIMINIRTSDQFAGAIVEAIKAGTCMLIGSWLNYSKLDELDIKYYPIQKTTELREKLENAIKNNNDFKKKYSSTNSQKIETAYSLTKIYEAWTDIYTK